MHHLSCLKLPIRHHFKSVIFHNHISKRKISDTCESKIITLTKSKDYDHLKIYRSNIYNGLYENQILQGVKVHRVDSEGYGEIAIYSARQHLLFFLKFFLLIPEEQVNLKVLDINKKKKKTIFQVLCKTRKSKYEIVPRCEYFSKCGGCIYQHIDYKFERKLKKNLLISLCEKYNINVLASGKDYLQNDHYFCEEGEQNEEDMLEISQIKREYMSTDLEEEDDDVETNNRSGNCTSRDLTPDQESCIPSQDDRGKHANYARLYDFLFSNDYHYRNKSSINLSVTDNLSIGFYKRHSYEICDVDKCHIHDEHIQNVYEQVKKEILDNFKKNYIYVFNKINNSGYLKGVDIKVSKNNAELQILISFIGFSLNDKAKKALTKISLNLASKNTSIKGIIYNVETNKLKQNRNEVILYGQNCIYHSCGGYTYKLGANTFFQPNQYLNECIVQIILKLVKNYKINAKQACVYDLFCGIGFYSLPLSDLFGQVISVDYSIDNIKNLEENVKMNNVKNVKCFNLNLFNLQSLRQINLHIRRYIVNLVKQKNYDVYYLLKEKLHSTYVSANSEGALVENLQVHSPYSTLPSFIYTQLNEWPSKEINGNVCSSSAKNGHTYYDNNVLQNEQHGNFPTEDSNKVDEDSYLSREFVIPIPDLVIINPPRKGCEKVFRRWLRGLCCRYIIYISCNANSQFRDINHLTNLGYVVKEIIPLDTFPRTPHFETVALLEFDFNQKVDNEQKQIMEFELNEIKSNKKKKK
ncbi:conserved Plasmodium protein, unknown function [Plasmodium knowlesi strain H]|uniref:SAM dependent methyltransferase n=3 Tax=Plasmodium knowlesi TaxID=5850 RepID=A0A5K1VDT0_PLAKH|nr:SAM dependent methyltransferase, putative [Plasmodium knowlesi strain H]OTN64087.1 Uncharacterized protein PKNOH_S140223600 [Plasmodium knowlesi]CAA9990664.1 SAM dependent methyltransferase, putative [Plasmodium knowlesi strain H]SBO25962.1 conserved Plasmodium protein, unknown function [Plasmodium knowlesi strain H]SBO28694.1 conserved Plasmodium protein, unknown function [Plasmodium knowlesi strain H]VVS80138.1 SAM dependent methyltransferase, putative [Plasmodium knowlesi strain H]|eukprot:XP_002261955.1 hypothetical protein, conserved in Plasmodium species [Plasmodium knowlesi strain H]